LYLIFNTYMLKIRYIMKFIKSIIKNQDPQKHFLGFVSIDDFISSFLKFKHWSFTSTFAITGGLTTFITGYVWDSYQAVYTLYALMIGDWITGIIKSMSSGNFESYKILRMPLFFLATTFILSISWWMAKSNMLFYLLPGLVMTGLYSVYFVSLLENLGEIGFLPKSLVSTLRKRFGLKALIDMTKTKADEKEK